MAAATGISRMAGRAGSLMAVIGLLTLLSAVFGLTPRTFVLVGVALFVLALAMFVMEEFGPGRKLR
ncbi:MAG TPA: hypothetical protein VGO43_00785 [Pyrinomonadaceae bacterium]|jgi:hypothetical protein|nr:hypothetical protein [Pyrinomonadaceae bacterium]